MFGLAKFSILLTHALAALAASGPTSPGAPLYAANGTKKLGTLYVVPNGTVALSPSPDLVTQFYIASSTLYAANAANTPHAYVNFDNTSPTCSVSGPVVFSTTNSNKCAQSQPFGFEGNNLVFGKGSGSFGLCKSKAGQYITYSTKPTQSSVSSRELIDCININIVQA